METPEAKRSGRARERARRRRERTQFLQEAAPPVARARQLAPQGQLRLPTLRLPQGVLRPVLYGVGGLVVLLAVVFGLRAMNPPTPRAAPNAIWLGTEWSYEQPSDGQVQALARRMRDNAIGTGYVWVTYLKADGTWSGASRSTDTLREMEPNIRAFLAQYRRAYPEGRLFGWVSLPTDTGGNRLGDTTVHTQMAEISHLLVNDYGFDGVYLNVEPVTNGSEGFLALLRAVRAQVGPNVPIAVAVPPDWSPRNATIPVSPLVTVGTEWSTIYKQNVALLADQILLMNYNSGLTNPQDYQVWAAYQVRAYAEAVASLNIPTQVLVGIPTYDAEPPGHDPFVENVTSAVAGVRSGLTQAGVAASVVPGLAIYAEWTTTEDEWAAFNSQWVNARNQR